MLEKGRISNIQMAIIIIPTIASTAILLAPAISAKYAKQDLWISPIWSSMIGFLIVIIVSRLNNHYPNETPIEYCCHIIGKIPGKLLGFLYLFFFIHQLGVIIQEYGNFIVGSFLHQTPLIVVMAAMVIVCAMAVYGGIEVIGRSSEIIFPVVVLFYFLVLIMLFKDLDTKQLLPIMENGLWPSFRGA
ncbi:MAG: GerAB/ArcD/ProY family transporter, partial [Tuberibacillus sp.]